MRQKGTFLIGSILALDLALLLLFGKNYTKFVLIEPFFYAHDLVLLIILLLCFPHYKFTKRIKSIELLFLIAILYLVYSFLKRGFEDVEIVLRQFMVFGYGLCLYLIMNYLFNNSWVYDYLVRYLKFFGLACVSVQLLYIPYLFLYIGINPFFERWYFSPIVMMGFFIFASAVLIDVKGKVLKNILYLGVFIVALSTGHDSTYLSLVLIYIGYLFVVISRKNRIILTIFLLFGSLSVFYFIPSFTDANVQWRLIFWKNSLLRIANNYFVFGEGYGIPYASENTLSQLNALYPDLPSSPRITEEENYVIAPHNSFLSMAIHVGILSILFLFYPVLRFFNLKRLRMDKEELFLVLSLFGMAIFCAFNVILELPHASSLFWMVLYSLILKRSETHRWVLKG